MSHDSRTPQRVQIHYFSVKEWFVAPVAFVMLCDVSIQILLVKASVIAAIHFAKRVVMV